MKTSLNLKIFIISMVIMLGGYSLAFSNSNLNLKEKDFRKIPLFYLNSNEVISQNGEAIKIDNNLSLNLINLTIDNKKSFDLINNYYEIQEVLLIQGLHIKDIEYKKFGQIKIQTNDNKFIKFQDFQISNQLKTLKLFFLSDQSKNLLKDFKSIDLRHRNKLAIGYF